MKTKYLLLIGVIAVFGSCSSAYRIGQTPDDVYYSPAPEQDAYVTSENQQDKDSYVYNNNIEDLSIRRGINDPLYRSSLSLSMGYGYNPYDFYGSSFYNPYNPYSHTGATFYPYNNYYNSFYSPYTNFYSPYYNSYYPPLYYVTKPGVSVRNYSGPRQYNLGAYNVNTNHTIPAATTTGTSSAPVRTFKPAPTTTGVGGFVRRIFTPSDNTTTRSNNNYNNNDNNNSGRTFQPGTSSGNNSSSSGGGGGSAPTRTFRH